jgi:hypothetical protein
MRSVPVIQLASEDVPDLLYLIRNPSGKIIARLSAGAVAALFVVAGVDVPAGGDSDD